MQRAATGLATVCADLLARVYGARVVLLVGSGNNGGDALYAGALAGRAAARGSTRCCSPTARTRAVWPHCAGPAAGWSTRRRRDRDADLVVDGILGIGGRGGLRGAGGRAWSARCPTTHWWSRSTSPAASTRRPARSTASRSAPTSPSPSARSRPGCWSTRGPSRRARSSWSTSGSTSRRPASRCCRPTTSRRCCRGRPRVGQVPPRRRRGRGRVGAVHRRGRAVHRRRGAGRRRHGALRRATTSRRAGARARWPEVVVGAGRVQAWTVGSGGGGDAGRAARPARSATACRWSSTPTRSPPCAELGAPRRRTAAAHAARRRAGAAARRRPRRRRGAAAAPRPGRGRATWTPSCCSRAPRRSSPGRTAGSGSTRPGPPALATAGSGDVLAGLCGRCWPAGSTRFDAGSVGAWLHGLAGRLAAEGGAPVVAADVLDGPAGAPLGRLAAVTSSPRPQHAEARVDLGAIRDNVAALRARTTAPRCWPWSRPTATATACCPPPGPRSPAARPGSAPRCSTRRCALRAAGITEPRVLAWLLGPGRALGRRACAPTSTCRSTRCGRSTRSPRPPREAGRPARVHLKVDTGLSRGGAALADWPDLVEAARKAEADGAVAVVGLWSHFAYADAPGHPTIGRAGRGVPARAVDARRGRRASPRGAPPGQLGRHPDRARSSTSTWCGPGSRSTDSRRCPTSAARPTFGLRPAMTLRRRARAGEAGPGRQRRVATATPTRPSARRRSGWCRSATPTACRATAGNVGPVLAAGRRRTVAGRVCMDQLVLDLGDDDARGRRPGRALRPRRRRRADRAGLGGRDRHHLLRDRHPGRAAGAAGLRRRERVGGAVSGLPTWGRRAAVVGAAAGVVAAGAAVGLAAERYAVGRSFRAPTTLRPTSRSASCAAPWSR